jgi:hypothetical protein
MTVQEAETAAEETGTSGQDQTSVANPEERPPHASDDLPPELAPPLKVDDIRVKRRDETGAIIEKIYHKVPGLYAVYRVDGRILAHLADDPEQADKQRSCLVQLGLVRGTVETGIEELAGGGRQKREKREKRVHRYRRQLADCVALAILEHPEAAKSELDQLAARVAEDLRALSAQVYLKSAIVTGLALLMTLLAGSWTLPPSPTLHPRDLASVSFAACIGTIGALFSTALSIKGRAIKASVVLEDTIVDAAVRVLVGAAAGVLSYAAVKGGVVGLTVGDAELVKNNSQFAIQGSDWLLLLLLAFSAGFAERTVPDLVGRINPDKAAPSGATENAGAGPRVG